ncbi:unnamed protein product, partial [marine sediment metagenome]
ALKMYYVEGKSTKEVAAIFGYKHRGFTTIVTGFNKKIKNGDVDDLFFTSPLSRLAYFCLLLSLHFLDVKPNKKKSQPLPR